MDIITFLVATGHVLQLDEPSSIRHDILLRNGLGGMDSPAHSIWSRGRRSLRDRERDGGKRGSLTTDDPSFLFLEGSERLRYAESGQESEGFQSVVSL